MAHYYRRDENGNIVANHDITPKEAKRTNSYTSVTTKLKIVSNEFLDTWSKDECIKLAQVNPQLPDEDIKDYCRRIRDLVYGTFRRHYDGKEFPSSEFGTTCHKCLEEWNVNKTPFPIEWEMYCTGWVRYLEENQIEPFKSEYIVMDDEMKVAGSIDFIGYQDGMVLLCDYKFRECKDGSGKFYANKDLPQIAIESLMYSQEQGLGYIPMVKSVCIDVLTGQYHIKNWTAEQRDKGIREFKAINHVFNVLNGWE